MSPDALGEGKRLEGLGDYKGALRVYGEALGHDPSSSDLWSARAWVLMRLRRDDEALEASGEAIRLNPTRAFLYKDHALILFRHGDRGAALEYFRRAVELDPDRPGLRLHLAQALLHVGSKEEAAHAALEAIQVARRRPDPHLYGKLASAGRILHMSGHPSEGVALLREAMAMRPNRRGISELVAAATRELEAHGSG